MSDQLSRLIPEEPVDSLRIFIDRIEGPRPAPFEALFVLILHINYRHLVFDCIWKLNIGCTSWRTIVDEVNVE